MFKIIKQKVMYRKMEGVILLLAVFFVWPCFVNAATGDVLYQNCASGTCTGAGSNNGWTRTVETNGCYSGSCLKLTGVFNTNTTDGYGAGNTPISTTNVSGKNEITVQFYVKFNENPRGISRANIKALRAYTGATSYTNCAYLINKLAGGPDVYVTHSTGSNYTANGFTPKDESETYPGDTRFSIPNGDGTWSVGTARIITGTIGSGPYGPTWKKFTFWLKLPTSLGGSDGESKMWLNDDLIYHAYDQEFDGATQTTFSSLTFYPSSEAGEPFEHWMDNMIIYEGYVPPVPDPPVTGPTLSNPQPTSVLSAGTTSTTMSVSTNVAATCKYSTTPGTAYSSMSNTMIGGGTTSHSVLVSGLTNGSSTTYYLRCAKTSDGEATTTDFPITVSVLSTQHSLTTTKNGTGNGTLTSSPSGINCGSICSYNFNENSSVTVTAIPDSNSIFSSWSGCTSTDGNQCTVTMNTVKNITATFSSNIATCDADHYWACTDGPCQTQGFHFWEGACRTIPAPTDWTGTNIATNGTFTNWTNNLPDSWSSYTASNISEDNGACNIGESGHIYRSLPEIKTYRYAINIRNFADLFETWTDDEGSFYHYATDGSSRTITGLISYDGEGDRNVYFGQGTSNIVVDDIVIKEVLPAASFRSDVDGSSEINTTDALLTLRNSLGLSMNGTAWRASATTGDVNCDGVSNSTDALLILRHSLGLSMSGTGWCEEG